MESLNNILEQIRPRMEPRHSLAGPVLARIAAQKQRLMVARRSMWGLVALTTLATTIAVARSADARVLALGWQKFGGVAGHSPLYLRALGEAAPWTALGGLALAVILALGVKRAGRVAPAGLVRAVTLGTLSFSASAYAATTVTATPGAAVQTLERAVNGTGKDDATIHGQTYEFTTGLTDVQVRAQVEMRELKAETDLLPVSRGLDGGQDNCLCRVVWVSATEINFDWYYPGPNPISPHKLVIDANTHFYDGSKLVNSLALQPGDFVIITPNVSKVLAAYIAKPTYDPSNMGGINGLSAAQAAHTGDGRCYNNVVDACPNLPAVYDYLGALPDGSTVPAGSVIREVYGSIASLNDEQVQVKSSSGEIWTFVTGNWISAVNESGIVGGAGSVPDLSLQANVGDHLRVEFWQPAGKLNDRTVYGLDPNGPRTKAEAQEMLKNGTLNTAWISQVRALQLALQQPWSLGQMPVKY